MEHREGIEPSNTGFADQRVSHFAIGALAPPHCGGVVLYSLDYFGCAVVRR
jgi:hypothetical protein